MSMLCVGLDSAEYFDPRAGEWKTIASMSVRRSSVGVGVVGGKSFILSESHSVTCDVQNLNK